MKEKKRKKNCKQMVEVQTRKRRNKIDSGRGGRDRNNTLSGENLGRRPAGVKGGEKKNACIVVFIIWLPSFCCICEMKEKDGRGMRKRTRMTGGRKRKEEEGQRERTEEREEEEEKSKKKKKKKL